MGGRPPTQTPFSETNARFSPDGREMFYLSTGPKAIMSVPVKGGATFEPGEPSTLCKATPMQTLDFDVTSDGQRFLVNTTAGPTPFLSTR